MTTTRLPALILVVVAHGLTAASAWAQPVIADVEDLDWDRPEAWAMKYFNSVVLMTSMGPVEAREPGSVELALDGGWIPHLSLEQRTVGFNGTKEEDLNKVSAFGRVRATVGLPRKYSLEVGFSPPVEINGVEALLIGLAVQRPVLERDPWSLGLRLHAQTAEIEGDFTCPEEIVRFEPGSPDNLFGCLGKSDDTSNLDYVGLEVNGGYRLGGPRAPVLHFAVSGNYMDMEFQVNAPTFGVIDRSRRLADGLTVSLHGGVTWPIAEASAAGLELFYSPLSVMRPGDDSSGNDGLFNVRAIFRHRF